MSDETPDPMQIIFDGTEEAQMALHSQEGCERALILVLDALAFPARDEGTILALIDSMAAWRSKASREIDAIRARVSGS